MATVLVRKSPSLDQRVHKRAAPIADLVAATGLSEHYCSLIRLGKRTPHARHWHRFQEIALGRAQASRDA